MARLTHRQMNDVIEMVCVSPALLSLLLYGQYCFRLEFGI
jgi:hypothetical protein